MAFDSLSFPSSDNLLESINVPDRLSLSHPHSLSSFFLYPKESNLLNMILFSVPKCSESPFWTSSLFNVGHLQALGSCYFLPLPPSHPKRLGSPTSDYNLCCNGGRNYLFSSLFNVGHLQALGSCYFLPLPPSHPKRLWSPTSEINLNYNGVRNCLLAPYR